MVFCCNTLASYSTLNEVTGRALLTHKWYLTTYTCSAYFTRPSFLPAKGWQHQINWNQCCTDSIRVMLEQNKFHSVPTKQFHESRLLEFLMLYDYSCTCRIWPVKTTSDAHDTHSASIFPYISINNTATLNMAAWEYEGMR